MHLYMCQHTGFSWYLAPSHYLNQWWFIVNKSHRNTIQWNLNKNTTTFIQENLNISSANCKPYCSGFHVLTHCGRMTHICISTLTRHYSDNGLLPGRRQAIIWTNAGILLIGTFGTNFSEILIKICTFSFKKIHLKMSGKWRPFCLGLNVLTHNQ